MYGHREKIGLSVLEAGWLLEKTESQVRSMLRRGELWYVVDGSKIDPESVEEQLGSAFALMLLRRLLEGLLVAPRPERRSGPPVPLVAAFDALMLASPAMVRDARTGEVSIVPRLHDQAAGDQVGEDGKESSLTPILSFVI